ncbi:MAG: N-acetyl sugar amidotransferase, partial [Pseudomonadota bacterium]
MLKYCQNCILPSTRPNLIIEKDGVCSACKQKRTQDHVDWGMRKKMFEKLVYDLKTQNTQKWDCVIPVSGGKDSTWQVIKCLEYGLTPLCVTWKTPGRNDLGHYNLQNLIDLGVDHFDVSINPHTEKTFTLKAFKRLGATAIPMHMAIFAIPVQVALNYSIPLILWGENSATQYGHYSQQTCGFQMTREWLLKYGVTNGTIAQDWFDDDLNEKNMAIYYWPNDKELKSNGIRGDFLGEYFLWDPIETFKEAKKVGFKAHDKPKMGYYEFADVDDDFLIILHHWMKWYKFGFTRLWDNLSLEIRHHRMRRDDAVQMIFDHGEEKSLKEIDKFCKYVDISTREFYDTADGFRNKDIWIYEKGKWKI